MKAEIEKLRAAQRSRQNVDPERYRLCQQEIASLRMKLHRQERDMAEMQRWVCRGRAAWRVVRGLRGLRVCCPAPRGRRAGASEDSPLPSRPT